MKLNRQHQAIVKAAVQAIVQGDWDVGARVERVGKILADNKHLSTPQKRAIVRELKHKLALALRAKRGLIVSAAPLSQSVQNNLSQQAHNLGAVIVENQTNPDLIAGFQFQLGDDRWDASLKHKLEQFIEA